MIDSQNHNGVEHVDVAIVGGGLVGSALTAAIASDTRSNGLSIALVDPSPPTLHKLPAISLRTSTITPTSKIFLDKISAWSKVPEDRIAPFHDMLIWDNPSATSASFGAAESPSSAMAGAIRFDAEMTGASELGHVLDNDTLRHAIFMRIHELQYEQNARLRVIPSAISDIEFGGGDAPPPVTPSNESNDAASGARWPVIRMENGGLLAARLLIACDGARSRVRTLAGMEWHQRPYGLSAVVATVEADAPVTTAYQRFLSTGPVAVLPLSSGKDDGKPLANIVWTTTRAEAHALAATDDATFVAELNAALRNDEDAPARDITWVNTRTVDRADLAWAAARRLADAAGLRARDAHSRAVLPRFERVRGARGSFPLHWGHAPRYIDGRKRVVLVGDAAHAVHPLAGQGVNLGFADASALADAVNTAAADGRDIGGEDGAPLMPYQAARLPANAAMLGLLNSLQWLFDRKSPLLVRDLRRVGMSLLDSVGPAKRSILRMMR